MELTFQRLVQIARRGWWILLLAPLISGAVAYVVVKSQQPLYSAAVIIKVNPPVGTGANLSALQVTQNLTETYRLTMLMSPVLDQVASDLHLPYGSEDLAKKCKATAIRNTQLIKLAVSDKNPAMAAQIANAIAEQFIANLNAERSAQLTALQSDVNDQTDKIQQKLSAVNQQIGGLEKTANANEPSIQNQLADLRLQRDQLQQQIANLETQAQSATSALAVSQTQVTISQPAVPPGHPYTPQVLLTVLLATFTAIPLGIGIVALIEFLDNSVRGSTDAAALTGSPVLAAVGIIPKLGPGPQQLFAMSSPRSKEAEAIRLLRANLQFAAAVHPLSTLVITSAEPSEGKSTIAANLAVVMAQSGLATVVVDADLRNPSQQRIFDVPNARGLTTLMMYPNLPWDEVGIRVGVSGLTLIPSGPLPPNPADLLSSEKMSELLRRITMESDIVLIDTPPVLAVSDPMVIGAKMDGAVLVARARKTRRDRLQRAAGSLAQAGVRLVGVVTQQTDQDGEYAYYYYGDK